MTSTTAVDRPLLALWRHHRRHRPRVVLAVVASVVNKVADVAPELLIGVAVDIVVRGGNSWMAALTGSEDRFTQLIWLAAVNAVVWLIESLSQYASSVLWRGLAQAVEHELRVATYDHVQRLDLAFHETRTSGDLLSVLSDDVNQLERFLDDGAAAIIRVVVNVVVIGAVFAVSSWQLTLFAFAPVPVIVAGALVFQRRLAPRYQRVREAVGVVSTTLTVNLGGLPTIKAFSAEDRERDRVAGVSEAYRVANREVIRWSSAFVPLIRLAILSGFTATLLLGGWLVLQGRLEVGLYSVLVFITQRLLWPLTELGQTLDLYQRAMASTRRIFTLLQQRPSAVGGPALLASPVRGRLELRGVRFGYADGPDVLHGVDLVVPAGQLHAVVGATGAGKSSLLRLVLRFGDPRAGAVLLDGVDVRGLTWDSLRGAIGYVSQDAYLFHGTIAENVAYGRPDATPAQIADACRLAEAADFVEAAPHGYDTVVGERGQRLSGGQRQRLALARAILRDPALLVLDEATSAVDNETEAAIQRSLGVVAQGRTTLVVAHRLSTVRDADRIWVLAGGRVAEAGTHDELVALGGGYARLWTIQTGSHAVGSHAVGSGVAGAKMSP